MPSRMPQAALRAAKEEFGIVEVSNETELRAAIEARLGVFEKSPQLIIAFTVNPMYVLSHLGINFEDAYHQEFKDAVESQLNHHHEYSTNERRLSLERALRIRTLPNIITSLKFELASGEPSPAPSPAPLYSRLPQPTWRSVPRAVAVSDNLMSHGLREYFGLAFLAWILVELLGDDDSDTEDLKLLLSFKNKYENCTIRFRVDPDRIDEIKVLTSGLGLDDATISLPVSISIIKETQRPAVPQPIDIAKMRELPMIRIADRLKTSTSMADMRELSARRIKTSTSMADMRELPASIKTSTSMAYDVSQRANASRAIKLLLKSMKAQEKVENFITVSEEVISNFSATVTSTSPLVKKENKLLLDLARGVSTIDHGGALNDYHVFLARAAADWFKNSSSLELLKFENGQAENLELANLYKVGSYINNPGIAFTFGGLPSWDFLGDLDVAIATPKKVLLDAIQASEEYFEMVLQFIASGGELCLDGGVCLTSVPLPYDIYHNPEFGPTVRFRGSGVYKFLPFRIGFEYFFDVNIYCENNVLKERVVGVYIDIEDGWEIMLAIFGVVSGFLTFGLAGAVVGGLMGALGSEIVEDLEGGKVEADIRGNSLFESMGVGPLEIQSKEFCGVYKWLTGLLVLVEGYRDR